MLRIRLTDEDRERLGAPEWLTIDPGRLPVEDFEALQAAGGSLQDFVGGPGAVRNRVWLGLHKAGANPPPVADLTFNVLGMRTQTDEAEPGKAPSAKSADATPSTSPASTAGRRKRPAR